MLRTLILGLAALAAAEDMSAAEHAAMAHTTGLAEHKVGLHEDHPLVRDPTKLIGLDDEQNAEYQAAKAAPGDGKKLDDLIPEDHPWRNGALPHGDGKFMGDAAATAEFNEGHPMVGGDEQGDETEHGNDFLSSYKHMYDDDVPYYDSFKPKWYELTYERKHFILNVITAALLLFLAVSCFRFHLDGIKNWWRRRVAAAQYKKMKKDDNDKERGDPRTHPRRHFSRPFVRRLRAMRRALAWLISAIRPTRLTCRARPFRRSRSCPSSYRRRAAIRALEVAALSGGPLVKGAGDCAVCATQRQRTG